MRAAHTEAVASLICYHIHTTVDSGDCKQSLLNMWRCTLYAPRQNGGVFCQQMVLLVEIQLTCGGKPAAGTTQP